MIFKRLFLFAIAFATCAQAAVIEPSQPDCSGELSTSFIIPKDLKLSKEAASYLLQNESHRELIEALSNIFLKINDYEDEFNDIAQSAEGFVTDNYFKNILQRQPFFIANPKKLTPSVEANFADLWGSVFLEVLPPDQLAIFAYLLSDLRRKAGTDRISHESKVDTDRINREMDTLNKLLSKPRYAKAITAILTPPQGRLMFAKFLLTMVKDPVARGLFGNPDITFTADKYIDELITKIQKRKLDPWARAMIKMYFFFFSTEIARGGPNSNVVYDVDTLFSSLKRGEEQAQLIFLRNPTLLTVSDYFAENLKVKSSISDITDVFDSLYFQTPVPEKATSIFPSVLEKAKKLLQPLKVEWDQYSARNRPAVYDGPKFEVKLIDHYTPVTQRVWKSRKKEKEEKPEASATESIEKQIDPQYSLREWTSYVESKSPRALAELKANQTYLFWFLREEDPSLQSVRISESVVEWIQRNPSKGRQFLNALHMGRARISREAGIKILGGISSPYVDGPAFELKIFEGERGMLYQVGGIWYLTAIVAHDDVHHTVETVDPKIKP